MSDENIQYALLALVSGLEAYTKRSNEISDFKYKQESANKQWQQRQDYESPYRQLQMDDIRSRIESRKTADDRRQAKATSDPIHDLLRDTNQTDRFAVLQSMVSSLSDNGSDYDQAVESLAKRRGEVDKEFPMPADVAGFPASPQEKNLILRQRDAAKKRIDAATGGLYAARSKGLTLDHLRGIHSSMQPTSPAPAVATGAGGGPMGGMPASRPSGPAPGFQTQPPGATPVDYQSILGEEASAQRQQQATQRLTGDVGTQTGGAPLTDPRLPPGAAENFQNFANAPQGQDANHRDHYSAGEVAQLFWLLEDENTPFETKGWAYLRAHTIFGTPIPDVFQQWFTGQGIPRSVIDSRSNAPGGQDPMSMMRQQSRAASRPMGK